MGITDCLSDDVGVVGYLYDRIAALAATHVDNTVSIITKPRKLNGADMPDKYVYIEIIEMPVDKHSMNPCSFSQGITVAVDVLLPYNQDELSRRLVRVIQAIFYTQLEYAMIVRAARTDVLNTPVGNLSGLVVDLDVILQRGII